MQKSIVTKYFCFCSAIILACVICISSVLLLVACQFYKTEKKEALIASVNDVITATRLCYLTNHAINTSDLNTIYTDLALSKGTDFALVNESGAILASSDQKPYDFAKEKVDELIIDRLSFEGHFEVGTLNGFFKENNFIFISKCQVGTNKYCIISYLSAAPLSIFFHELVEMFLVACIIIVFFILILVYFSTKRLLNPIKEMTAAAERFGKGDFSTKINIVEENEIGILASALNEMAYSLSTLENSRKSFIANISHELKTPMTTIGGFVDGILDGTIPQEQHKHYLTIVSEEISRLSRLVRSMLNIAKYETGEMELKVKPFDITYLTVKTVLLFENRIQEKHLEVRGLDAEAFYVLADIDLTQQIIYNLVENAVKFVNDGGYISFKFEEDADKVTVSIRNSGEGLTQDELPKVFDRFYKTDESHGKDKSGVGLGLAIVRSIINLHGGNVLVKSTKGEYTEFSFSLLSGKNRQKQ